MTQSVLSTMILTHEFGIHIGPNHNTVLYDTIMIRVNNKEYDKILE